MMSPNFIRSYNSSNSLYNSEVDIPRELNLPQLLADKDLGSNKLRDVAELLNNYERISTTDLYEKISNGSGEELHHYNVASRLLEDLSQEEDICLFGEVFPEISSPESVVMNNDRPDVERWIDYISNLTSLSEVAALEQHDRKNYRICGRLFGVSYAPFLPDDSDGSVEVVGRNREWNLVYQDIIEDSPEVVMGEAEDFFLPALEDHDLIDCEDAERLEEMCGEDVLDNSVWSLGYDSLSAQAREMGMDISLSDLLDSDHIDDSKSQYLDLDVGWRDEVEDDPLAYPFLYTVFFAAHTDLYESDRPSKPSKELKKIIRESCRFSVGCKFSHLGKMSISEGVDLADRSFMKCVENHDRHDLLGQLENIYLMKKAHERMLRNRVSLANS